jgi:hypothetical protein
VRTDSNKCMIVRGTASEAKVVQYTCLPQYRDQRWTVEYGFDGVTLRNDNSKKCLVVRTTANEALPVQSTCNDSYTDQTWWFA